MSSCSSGKQKHENIRVVLLAFSGFMLIISLIELITRSQEYIYYITVIGTLVFWPLIMLMFIITVVISLFDKGEEVHRTILMQ